MRKLPSYRTTFRLLILCLCMVSLWIAPVFLEVAIPVGALSETDSDPYEFDDDLFSTRHEIVETMDDASSRVGTIYLSAKPASLGRLFSPPKSTHS